MILTEEFEAWRQGTEWGGRRLCWIPAQCRGQPFQATMREEK